MTGLLNKTPTEMRFLKALRLCQDARRSLSDLGEQDRRATDADARIAELNRIEQRLFLTWQEHFGEDLEVEEGA